MKSSEIRKKFLAFFERKSHGIVASSGLIPKNDPTLLFTNAGMVQFKNIFLGSEKFKHTRAASCQKSLRAGGKHNDLENVGKTSRHHTFFEMLGNFSFGDYFKEDAISFAWEFLTKELKIDKQKLYVTVHHDDNDAKEIWLNSIKIDEDRIYKLGDEDNFWSMGDTGPCGPCSEIMYDIGQPGPSCPDPKSCSVECDCGRFLEIWNLVFMQFDRAEDGSLSPLPKPSIDTGMGLERLASVLQDVKSNYDTDLFKYLTDYVADFLGKDYGKDPDIDISIRVLSDHARAVTFLISDGVIPSSDGRGYVARRILRRAVRHYKKLGISKPFLHNLVHEVIENMGKFYPELISQDANIVSIVLNEEEKFLLTIDRGFDQLKEAMLSSSKTKVLSGKDVFKLYDTFGFPVDLIQDIASETDYVLDMKAYEEEMLNQRNSSKKASKFKNPVGDSIDLVKTMNLDSSTRFVGYQNLDSESKVFAIIKDNEIVPSAGGKEKIGVILESTSFYAESGGQVGDKGFIKTSKCLIDIFDTQKTKEGFFIHSGIVREGEIKNGDKVEVSVDGAHRLKIAQHHTATHILHSALREILGDHVRQAGSLVKSDRLRFDFSHFSNIKLSTLKQIENLSNERIRLNNDVIVDENVDYNKAIKSGATAFFEDKYGDSVRVVRIGDFSMELCGGTHIKSSGEIGSLCISSESSISSGIRRIEAHVGESGMAYMNKIKDSLIASSGILNSSIDKVQDGILRIQKENDSLKSKLSGYERKATQNLAEEVLSNCEVVNDIRIVSYLATNMSSPQLKSLWDDLKKIKKTIGLLGSNNKDGSILICAASSDVENFNCKDFLNIIAPKFNGKGGGKSNLAQFGCDYIHSLEEGLSLIKSQL